MYLHKSIDGDEFETVTVNYGNHNINISVLVRNCFLRLMSAKIQELIMPEQMEL